MKDREKRQPDNVSCSCFFFLRQRKSATGLGGKEAQKEGGNRREKKQPTHLTQTVARRKGEGAGRF